jgi:hypothetical protein
LASSPASSPTASTLPADIEAALRDARVVIKGLGALSNLETDPTQRARIVKTTIAAATSGIDSITADVMLAEPILGDYITGLSDILGADPSDIAQRVDDLQLLVPRIDAVIGR